MLLYIDRATYEKQYKDIQVLQVKKRFAQLYECLVKAKKAIAKEQSFFLYIKKALKGQLKYFPFDSANYLDDKENEFKEISIAIYIQ